MLQREPISLSEPKPEVGIYRRKQENKNSTKKAIKKTRKIERKHTLDQESDQEKKEKLSFFLTLLFSFSHLWIAAVLMIFRANSNSKK